MSLSTVFEKYFLLRDGASQEYVCPDIYKILRYGKSNYKQELQSYFHWFKTDSLFVSSVICSQGTKHNTTQRPAGPPVHRSHLFKIHEFVQASEIFFPPGLIVLTFKFKTKKGKENRYFGRPWPALFGLAWNFRANKVNFGRGC